MMGQIRAGYTTQIALALQAQGAQATFFVTGKDPGQTWTRVLQTCDPKIAPQGITWDRLHVVNLMQGLGHAVGIHGWIHTNLWDQQGTDPANEVKQVVDALEGISVHPDHLLRAPGGQWPAKGIKGYEGWYWYGWDLPPAMIDPNGADAATIKQRFSKALDDAGYPDNPIILLHSPRAGTADAILDLLKILRSKGYTQFKSLKEPRPGDTPGHPIGKYGIGAR